MREGIDWLEGLRLAMFEDDSRARNPVSFFAVNQMPENVVRAPRIRAFIAHSPLGRKASQQRVKSRWRSPQGVYCLVKLKLHSLAPINDLLSCIAAQPSGRREKPCVRECNSQAARRRQSTPRCRQR